MELALLQYYPPQFGAFDGGSSYSDRGGGSKSVADGSECHPNNQ
jgi:hypothetical protein